QLPAAGDRASWLQAEHPMADVVIVPDICPHPSDSPCPPECSPAWAARLTELGLAAEADCVVSSEGYGLLLAVALGVAHECYDPGRVAVTASGTQARAELAASWVHLPQATRAGLHRRVVVLGAESTGTTTLARDLAVALGAPLTHEEGRTYSWRLAAEAGGLEQVTWTQHHFWQIVLRQRQAEALAAAAASAPGEFGPWLVCDTDALATVAWWERYLPDEPVAALSAAAHATLAELYLITSPDGVPFEDDGMRDGEHLRHLMHDRFMDLVASCGRPHVVLTGDRATRVEAARAAIEQYESAHPRFVV
ncbi:MAG: AAA family ATPase, partial [Ilumatobacteraceae bacterium]